MSDEDSLEFEDEEDFEWEEPIPEPIVREKKVEPSTSFGRLVKKVAAKYGRRHIGWPCDDAQDIPIGEERSKHIKYCSECERLMEELEKKVGLR